MSVMGSDPMRGTMGVMTIMVGVLGAAGRMGATVCGAVHDADGLELVAAVDPTAAGRTVADVGGAPVDLAIADDVAACMEAGADVVVDFTVAAASRSNLPRLAEAGIHAVVGTTGFGEDDLAAFGDAFTSSNCVIAANFAISAVLMMRFAELAAPLFDTVEIIEFHHDAKVDAPSGTAMATAERIAAASDQWRPDPTETEVVAGARGGKGPGDIRMHAVRMHGMLAHQDVIFGAEGQTLRLRQDSYDRSSFMPGVVLAVRRIADHPGVTIGLDSILGV
jgi:4-hydroxy-tetrahydrodipicolinate reductase